MERRLIYYSLDVGMTHQKKSESEKKTCRFNTDIIGNNRQVNRESEKKSLVERNWIEIKEKLLRSGQWGLIYIYF